MALDQTMTDPESPVEDSAEGTEEPAGFEISIEVAADGSITVSKEDASMEASEGAEPAEGGQPAKDIGEALKIVLQLYRESQAGNSEEAMAAGFNKVRGGA